MVASSSDSLLLLKAAILPAPEAEACWKRWREAADLDRLDERSVVLLPMVANRFKEWLDNDPARNTLLGICKRAWTQNQIGFRTLAGLVAALRQSGIERLTVLGSAAWALRYQEHKALRPIDSLELLVARGDALQAARVLGDLGWPIEPHLPNPEGEVLDHYEGVWLRSAGGEHLKLSWRLLPASPEIAADCEVLPKMRSVDLQGTVVQILPDEEMLVHAIGGHREDYQVDWRCDALWLLDAGRMDWDRVRRLVELYPSVRNRLRELRDDWQAAVPSWIVEGPALGMVRRRLGNIWRDYRWIAWERRQPRTAYGLIRYVIDRWWRVFAKREGTR